MFPTYPAKAKTRKSFDIPGHVHELTFSTKNRHKFLAMPEIAKYFVENLDNVRKDFDLEILAYVVMPEHCHILILPNHEHYSISKILRAAKAPVALYALKQYPELREQCAVVKQGGLTTYQFWQPGGGYDRNMWTDEAIQNSIAYIHNNPVKRYLSNTPKDWPWSSASRPLK